MELKRTIGTDRCVKLRWKGLYVEAECDPENDVSHDTALWCQHTYKCVGPDGAAVEAKECAAGRECFEKL